MVYLLLLALPLTTLAVPLEPRALPWGMPARPYRDGVHSTGGLPGRPHLTRSPPLPQPAPPSPSPPSSPMGPHQSVLKNPKPSDRSSPLKTSQNKADVFRMSEANSIALFNGKPVDLKTGALIDNNNQNWKAKLKKRSLRKKLGLEFLDEEGADEARARESLRDPNVGAFRVPYRRQLLVDPRDTYQPMEDLYELYPQLQPIYPYGLPPPGLGMEEPTSQVAKVAVPDAHSQLEAEEGEEDAQKKEHDSSPKQIEWKGTSLMVYNGVPVEGVPVERVFDVIADHKLHRRSAEPEPGPSPLHQKLGLFEFPSGYAGRRKSAKLQPALESNAGPGVSGDNLLQLEPHGRHTKPDLELDPKYGHHEDEDEECDAPPHTTKAPDEPEELSLDDLANGRSFVIYNGVPIEINGSAVKNKSLKPSCKRPRPAFPNKHSDYDHSDGYQKRSAIPGPGKVIKDVVLWAPNPITGGMYRNGVSDHAENKSHAAAEDKAQGETSSEASTARGAIKQTP